VLLGLKIIDNAGEKQQLPQLIDWLFIHFPVKMQEFSTDFSSKGIFSSNGNSQIKLFNCRTNDTTYGIEFPSSQHLPLGGVYQLKILSLSMHSCNLA
jgi:hypothetical protein